MPNFSSKLLQKIQLTSDTFQFDFSRDSELSKFQTGQFFLLEVDDGGDKITRAYSTASPEDNNEFFSLVVKLIPGGRASEFFRKMKIGDEVMFQGPFGNFVLKDSKKDIIMIATGTGIAPFMGMIPMLLDNGRKQPITLYFGVRFETDLFYANELREWEKKYPNFKAVISLSKPTEKWTGLSGRITEHFADFDPKNVQVYICGNGDMVKSVKELMESKGVAKVDLNFELFTAI